MKIMRKSLIQGVIVILLTAGPVTASNFFTPETEAMQENHAEILTPREQYLTEENERLCQENMLLRHWIGDKGMKALVRSLDKKYKDVMPELRVYPSYPGPKD